MDLSDSTACYRAVESRDPRFDGMFYTAVRSTGIYCRPSCPARTPRPGNVTFHATAAAAQAAGFRACKRCLPDATPGSPAWDVRADVAGRAMRLIADGVVEREGVEGLAERLGYSGRHLTRLLTDQLGAGPLALARARRAQQARTLIETTTWPLSDVAYAAGFRSVRQFNDTIREVYATTPRAFRDGARGVRSPREQVDHGPVELAVGLPVRTPFDARALWEFLDAHLVTGIETTTADGGYLRSLLLPHGPATVHLDLSPVPTGSGGTYAVPCVVRVSDLRDVAAATERCRRLLDADCDPVAVDAALADDPVLAPLVGAHPGLRVPGQVDGDEIALRTVLGQQVSLSAGNRLGARLVARLGEPLPPSLATAAVHRLFPTASAVAAHDPAELPMPRARAAALVGLAAALADGRVVLDRSEERAEVSGRLRALRGIGPWTAGYVAMRALGDPDVFLGTDVAVLRALRGLGVDDPAARSETWRPWRSYALLHLWTTVLDQSRARREES